jgi:DNA invertase Pin-like site-specific DNA recombinase
MKVAIYCRVSTDDQDADKQEDICLDYCKKNNFEVYKIYKDVISGTKESRPSFNLLLEDLRQMKFNCVMVTRLDRMGRSLQHLLSLFEEFNKRGVNFISVTQILTQLVLLVNFNYKLWELLQSLKGILYLKGQEKD